MLSQAEIDALLSGSLEVEDRESQSQVNLAELMGEAAAPPPKTGARQVQPYNFWSPDRFSKEQMRAVEIIHEDFAERLTTSLPSFLRINLRPRVVHTEQGRFHDFLKDVGEETLFHLVTLQPLTGHVVVALSPDIRDVILEQRLGGQTERKSARRILTEIDQRLLNGLLEFMLGDLKAAWSKVVAVEAELVNSTDNQQWMQMMMGNERVLLTTFELSIQSVTGTMNVYVPYNLLKPVINQLNPHLSMLKQKGPTVDPEIRRLALQGLLRVALPVRVFLGNARLTLKELANLQPGDVLRLDTHLNQELSVQVAGRTFFRGRVGRIGNRLATQITAVVNPWHESNPPDAK